VAIHGEIWMAIATEPIAEGNPVCVTSVDGLTLTVRNARRDTP
jgi:membrane-bound ClpP family serine protease